MNVLARREREKAAFRDLVLKAAREIVLREGFDALTMRKIADAIEYSPGTLYLYFDSRDAIANELSREGFEQLLRALAPATALSDPRERLLDLGARYVRFGLADPETYRLLFMEDPKYSNAFFEKLQSDHSAGDQALSFLVACFDELRAQGRLASEAGSAELAEVFWAAVHGVVSLSLVCHDFPQTSVDRLSDVMRETLVRGVAPK